MGAAGVGLVGRGVELARLRELVAGVAGGRGGVVWVDGEPGIGKSVLLSAGLDRAQSLGCRVCWGYADETAAWFPLRVLVEALRVGPGVGGGERARRLWSEDTATGAPAAVTPRDAVAAAAEWLVALVERLCGAGPVVLVVDDAQWVDEASLAVLSRLRRLVGQLPLLLVAAGRPVPVRAEVERLGRGFAEGGRLVLTGLAEAEVVDLVTLRVGAAPGPGLCARVRQAGGNPLYVTELVDALVRDKHVRVAGGVAEVVDAGVAVPVSLAAAITTRLGFLSQPTTDVLRVAALLGVDFDVAQLGVVTGRAATDLVEAVQEALAAGVLAPAGDHLMFRHALIREALYGATEPGQRALLHNRAAMALAGAGMAVEQVAGQLLAASRISADIPVEAWVVGWLTGAAPVLVERAPQVAVDLFERVRVAAGVHASSRERLDVYLAEVLFQLGRNEQVEQVAGPALKRTDDPSVAARIAWTLGYALIRIGRYDQAVAATGRVLASPTLTAVWSARLHALQAMIEVMRGRYDEARDLAQRAETTGQQVGDRLAIGYALHALSRVQWRDQRSQSATLDTLDRALATIGEEKETTDLRLNLLGGRGAALANLGRVAEGDRVINEAVILAERVGSLPRLTRLRVQAAEGCFYAGQWDDAVAQIDAMIDLPLDPWPRLWLHGLSALIAIYRDDRVAADEQLHTLDDMQLASPEGRYFAEFLLVAQALTAERDGQPEQALARLLEAFCQESTPDFSDLTVDSPLYLPLVVRLALAMGDTTTAEAATQACEEEARRQPLPQTLASAQHCRGLLTADPALVGAAADAYRDIGYIHYQAQALENSAVLLAQRGDEKAARTAYTDAIRIYTSLDATWNILRADARLRPLGIRRGIRPRRRPTTGWDALTKTERTIADLVAAGHSNTAIADQLHLSHGTVRTHIAHILTKLGAHSRVDIAREVTNRLHSTEPAKA